MHPHKSILRVILSILVLPAITSSLPCHAASISRDVAARDGSTLRVIRQPDGGLTAVAGKGRPAALTDADIRALCADSQISTGKRSYIIQFTPPVVGSSKKDAPAVQSAVSEQHRKFRSDMAAIRSLGGGGGSIDPQIAHEYGVVFNGAALSLDEFELDSVKQLPYVRNVYPDRVYRAFLSNSVTQINADDVWNTLDVRGAGTVVAVIDTGINYNHASLGGGFGPGFKVIGGYDFVNSAPDPMDDNGHGTHCAGIVAANGSVKGVAPLAKLLAYKALDAAGMGLSSDIIAAIERACDPDQNPLTNDAADVISMSLGGPGHPDDPTCQAVDAAVDLGVVVVVAAGNESNYETVGSPGCARKAITVGASDSDDRIASFSSRGPAVLTSDIKPEVCAPGAYISSTSIGGGVESMSGTSMACPHVAGAAAILREMHPEWTPEMIKSTLTQTALDIGEDAVTQGGGRIDLYAAVQAQLVIEPAVLNLGYDDLSVDMWATTRTLSITNTSAGTINCNFIIEDAKLPPGVGTTITPNAVISPGETSYVEFHISVNNTAVANFYEPPYVYFGAVVAQYGDRTLRIPFAFNKEQPDIFEPNNTSIQAIQIDIEDRRKQVISLGRTKIDPTAQAASAPDEDWYKFSAQAGRVLFAYVDANTLGSPLRASLSLYDSGMNELMSNSDVDPAIKFFTIPATGTYYLKVASVENTVGSYRLMVNYLPQEVKYCWIPPIPDGGNPVESVRFSDAGDYLYTTQSSNYLTLFESAGVGVPVYNLYRPTANSYSAMETSADSSTLITAEKRIMENSTWTYSGTDWTRKAPASHPDRLFAPCMAFDAARGVTVLFGGRREDDSFSNETWTWDGSNWTKLNPPVKPPARYKAQMVYDAGRQVVVLFGGSDGIAKNDTWEWNGSTWTQRTLSPRPSPRHSFGLAYDSGRSVVVLFGGSTGSSETWEYNGAGWSQRYPPSDPGATTECEMCYDAARSKILMLRGDTCETWVYDGANWTRLAPATTPLLWPASWKMAYDGNRARVVAVAQYNNIGGSNSPYSETWEWDGVDWLQRSPANSPVRRSYFGCAYDTIREETVIFGGMIGAPTYSYYEYASQIVDKRITPSSTPVLTENHDYPDSISSIKVSADGNRIVSTTSNDLMVQDATGTIVNSIPLNYPSHITYLTTDGSIVVLQEDRSFGSDYLVVLNLDTETELFRFSINIMNVDKVLFSDDLSLMVHVTGKYIYGYRRNGIQYQAAWNFSVADWVGEVAVAGDGSAVGVAVRYTSGSFADLGITYYMLDGTDGSLIYTYTQAKDPACTLQLVPVAARANYDGSLFAFSSWGGDRRIAETVVFSPKCGVPVFELPTPGSAMCMDLSGNYLGVGTKGVHANILGGDGEVYVADLSAVRMNVPPLVKDVSVTPESTAPGEPVLLTCRASDENGVAGMYALIEAPDRNLIAQVQLYDDGKHSDGAAGDGVWGGVWDTPGAPRNYSVDIMAVDGTNNLITYDNAASFSTAQYASLYVSSCTLYGGNNTIAGVNNFFSLTVANNGTSTAHGVRVAIACNDPYVTAASTLNYVMGDIAPGTSKTGTPNAFWVFVSSTTPRGHIIPLTVTITDTDGGLWTSQASLPAVSRPVDHFEFAIISSPQRMNFPFRVTITAKDELGDVVTDYSGAVGLIAQIGGGDVTVGTGNATWQFPLAAFYHDARTQVLYLASEIGQSGVISALELDVPTLPGQMLTNWTIRMKHTSATSTTSWESTGWTVVYQSDVQLSTRGWNRFEFTTPFEYNGTDNLLIDFSFNNTSYSSDGEVRVTTHTGNRAIYFRTDSNWGDPLTWEGGSPSPSIINQTPNLRLSFGQRAAMEPIYASGFVNGVWSANVKILEECKGVRLIANDGQNHIGESNLFDVEKTGGILAPLKALPDGSPCVLAGMIVSAVFDGFFYIEENDRSCGIRVIKPAHSLNVGVRADILGTMSTTPDGERCIIATAAAASGFGSVAPLGMLTVNLGGGPMGLQGAIWNWRNTQGGYAPAAGVGTNNIGLLVRICGKVIASGRDWFYLDDGCGTGDGTGFTGAYIYAPGMTLPKAGTLAAVTGISSCEYYSDRLVSVLLPRSQEDIQAMSGTLPIPQEGSEGAISPRKAE